MKDNLYLMVEQKPLGTILIFFFSAYIVENGAFLERLLHYRGERKHLIAGCRKSGVINHKPLPRLGSRCYIETFVVIIVPIVMWLLS